MPDYYVRITAKLADGCEAHIDFDLADEPEPGDAAALLAAALDPEQTDLFGFIAAEHGQAGHEKVVLISQVKVR